MINTESGNKHANEMLTNAEKKINGLMYFMFLEKYQFIAT